MKPSQIAAALLIWCLILSAKGSESHWTGSPDVSQREQKTFEVAKVACSAVDSKGVRHRSDRQLANMIWLRDILLAPEPDYYKADKWLRRDGFAVFRLTLDPSTGLVREVTVLKPSEFRTLDSCSVNALRQWRWRPGKWKEIELPMWMSTFN